MSKGCDNCYADVLSRRLLSGIYRRRLPVMNTATNRADPFAVRIWPERLSQPAGWKGRRLVFVNSMSDLFHCDIPVEFLRAVFEVMLDVDRHTYQVLTKRPSRAARFVRQHGDLFGERGLRPHIWIGTSTIVGGESGVGRRPMEAQWVEDLRDECVAADVPFFFKQWWGRTPKAGGKELGGREWDEIPGWGELVLPTSIPVN